jgi:hypothetical protein
MPRCPSELGRAVAQYLKAVYCLFAIILLLNLLIAIYRYVQNLNPDFKQVNNVNMRFKNW